VLPTRVDAGRDTFEDPTLEICDQLGEVFVLRPPKGRDAWRPLLPAELTVDRTPGERFESE